MKITLTPALRQYMQARHKEAVIVEIAASDSSDFEVTELHPHFTTEKQAALFIKRKNFHRLDCDGIPVLLPNYRLEYAEEVIFDLKRIGPFAMVKTEGIGL